MVTITRNPAIMSYSVTFFYLLKHALLCGWPLLPQNSRPCFIAHFCSCIIYTSIRICALCSAVCLSQQSSVFSRPLPLPGFRHAMLLLEWLFLNNDSGSLVNAATNLSPWRRLLTPALGGLAAGLLLMGWQKFTQQRPHAPTDYMEALQTDGQFDYAASLVKSLASLLVVTSGSAIGREGAMILLAALAASVLPNVLRHARSGGIMDRLWGRGGNGCGLSCPLLAVYL